MNTPHTIRVMLVDDHTVVRSGLATFLRAYDDLELVGEAKNGLEAVSLCRQQKPDVILMDLMMPKMDGVSATRLIRKKYPGIQVVALTTFDDKELVQDALRAGAISYMLKNSPMETITETIRDASVGRTTLSASAIQSLIGEEDDDMPAQELSTREKEVLRFLSDGLKNAAIANKLNISEATVRFHVSNILRKLGAANRAQAVAIAKDRKLLL